MPDRGRGPRGGHVPKTESRGKMRRDGHTRYAPMLEATMPPPGPETYVFCCGPPPMIKSAIAKLEALGHDPSHVLCF